MDPRLKYRAYSSKVLGLYLIISKQTGGHTAANEHTRNVSQDWLITMKDQ
jgi:hypothetical protein